MNVSGAELQVAEYDLADVVRYGTAVGGTPASGGMIIVGSGLAGAYAASLYALNDGYIAAAKKASQTGATFEMRDRTQWLVQLPEKGISDWQRKLDVFFQDGVV